MRAGEYIQIIDVAGRQCTDFQCFAARKLDKGRERPLDVTDHAHADGAELSDARACTPSPSTRTCEPLVEVVQDTVRPPRCLRARLQRALLRRHGLSRPCQLHGEFQQRARALRHQPRAGLDGDQLLLQHRHRRA